MSTMAGGNPSSSANPKGPYELASSDLYYANGHYSPALVEDAPDPGLEKALELRHGRPQLHHARSQAVCDHEPLIPPQGTPAEMITRCSRSVAVLRDVAHPRSSPANSTRYRGPSSVRRSSILPATSFRAFSMTQCAGEVSRAMSWGCQRGSSSRMSLVSNKCSMLASGPAFQFVPATRVSTRPSRPRQCGPSAAPADALRCRG